MTENNKNNIILIGFMGSGKSTIGKLLAKKSGMNFIDTDHLIEEKEHMSIKSIFDQKGEEYFRMVESKVILELKSVKDAVIATGGGLPCANDNMSKLNAIGNTFYLNVGIKKLVDRLYANKDRPLLIKYTSKNQLYNFIKGLLQIRNRFYKKSIHIISGGRSIESVLNQIENKL